MLLSEYFVQHDGIQIKTGILVAIKCGGVDKGSRMALHVSNADTLLNYAKEEEKISNGLHCYHFGW